MKCVLHVPLLNFKINLLPMTIYIYVHVHKDEADGRFKIGLVINWR